MHRFLNPAEDARAQAGAHEHIAVLPAAGEPAVARLHVLVLMDPSSWT